MPDRADTRDELLMRWLRLRLKQEQDSGVLLAFPDSPRRNRLEEALREVGLRPTAVSRAADAIELLESDAAQTTRPFDLLIVFAKLPDLSGVELARFVRTRPYDPEIVLVTSRTSAEEAQQAIQARVSAYLGPEDSEPEALAARARVLWEAGLARRVRKLVLRDLKTLMETDPHLAASILPRIEHLVARHRDSMRERARVLVADPDQAFRKKMLEALGRWGLAADEAMGATTAIQMIQDENFDVLLIDPMHANMDPVVFMERARRARPDVDLVLLSRKKTLPEALAALRQGVADVILVAPTADLDLAAQRVASLVDRKYRMRAEELIIESLYRVLADQLLAARSGLPERAFRGMADVTEGPQASRPRRMTTLELSSGDYEVLAQADAVGLDAQDVPDADVLRFIDDILGSRQQDDGGSDKRIVQRVQAAVPILFRPVGGQEAHLGFSADLSLGGLAVGSEYVPKTGQELEMVLYVPEGAGLRPVRCQGRVVWASDEGGPEDVPAGFGVRFTVLGPEASEALRRIVVKAEQEDERS